MCKKPSPRCCVNCSGSHNLERGQSQDLNLVPSLFPGPWSCRLHPSSRFKSMQQSFPQRCCRNCHWHMAKSLEQIKSELNAENSSDFTEINWNQGRCKLKTSLIQSMWLYPYHLCEAANLTLKSGLNLLDSICLNLYLSSTTNLRQDTELPGLQFPQLVIITGLPSKSCHD